MSFCFVCGSENPDESDKEMFDAQMISNLKDRVNVLELCVTKKDTEIDRLRRSFNKILAEKIKDDKKEYRMKELESLLHEVDSIRRECYGDATTLHIKLAGRQFDEKFEALLPKEK